MTKRLIKLLPVLLSVLLVGCANTSGAAYNQPSAQQPHATIHGQGRAFAATKSFYISAIDGLSTGTLWSENSLIRVRPGKHVATVYMSFIKYGLLTRDGQQAELQVHFTAKPNGQYKVVGKVKGERIYGWVVDRRGRAAGPKASSSFLPLDSEAVSVPEMAR